MRNREKGRKRRQKTMREMATHSFKCTDEGKEFTSTLTLRPLPSSHPQTISSQSTREVHPKRESRQTKNLTEKREKGKGKETLSTHPTKSSQRHFATHFPHYFVAAHVSNAFSFSLVTSALPSFEITLPSAFTTMREGIPRMPNSSPSP